MIDLTPINPDPRPARRLLIALAAVVLMMLIGEIRWQS